MAPDSYSHFYSSHENVEETLLYHRGSLTYKSVRGDNWWFEWIKKDDGTWKLRRGGSDAVWGRYKINGTGKQ